MNMKLKIEVVVLVVAHSIHAKLLRYRGGSIVVQGRIL